MARPKPPGTPLPPRLEMKIQAKEAEARLVKEAERKNYAQTYYKKNRKRLMAKRKRRYELDERYRETVKTRALETKKTARESKPKPTEPAGPRWAKPQVFRVRVDDRVYDVECFTQKYLSVTLNRSKITLLKWEEAGILPPPVYKSTRGMRLYPAFQVAKILGAWERCRDADPYAVDHRIRSTQFPAYLKKIWEVWPFGFDLNTQPQVNRRET